jgi:hypothetical protein
LVACSVHHLISVLLPQCRRQGDTVRDLVQVYVAPATAMYGCCYVDYVDIHQNLGPDHVGPATAMLSYSWSYTFRDIVMSLAEWIARNPQLDPRRTYVWMCCLGLDQNALNTAVADSEALEAEFGHRVVRIGWLLPLLHPWDHPVYCTRLWCLFELYTAAANGVQVDALFVPGQRGALVKALRVHGLTRGFSEATAVIRSTDATATKPSDVLAIRALVQRLPNGFQTLDRAIQDRMNDFLIKVLAEADEDDDAELAPIPETMPRPAKVYCQRPGTDVELHELLLRRNSWRSRNQGAPPVAPAGAGPASTSAPAAACVLLHGAGGLGKTSLAAHTAMTTPIMRHFERIAFVTVGEDPDVLELLQSIHLQLVDTRWGGSNLTPAAIREALSTKAQGRTWLLIIDDVMDPGHLDQLNILDGSLPGSGDSKVMATSRRSDLKDEWFKVKVDVFDDVLAVEMVAQVAGLVKHDADPESEAVLKDVAKLCGQIPLLLSIVGMTIEEYAGDSAWKNEVVESLRADRVGAFVDLAVSHRNSMADTLATVRAAAKAVVLAEDNDISNVGTSGVTVSDVQVPIMPIPASNFARPLPHVSGLRLSARKTTTSDNSRRATWSGGYRQSTPLSATSEDNSVDNADSPRTDRRIAYVGGRRQPHVGSRRVLAPSTDASDSPKRRRSALAPRNRQSNFSINLSSATVDAASADISAVSVHHLTEVLVPQCSPGDTIMELVNLVIKPATANSSCSYVRHAGRHYKMDSDHVGPATAMLSYSWASQVKDVAAAIVEWVGTTSPQLDPRRTYIWMDCLGLNQNVDDVNTGPAAVAAHTARIRKIDWVLPLLHPLEAPIIKTRLWCLFELYTASSFDSRVDAIFVPGQPNFGVSRADVAKRGVADVSSTTAVANRPADVAALRAHIKALPNGFRTLDRAVQDRMNAFAISAMIDADKDDKLRLATIPDSLPAPNAVFCDRPDISRQLRDVLLDCSSEGDFPATGVTRGADTLGPASRNSGVLLHGLGGCGKSTAVANTVTSTAILRYYERIAFVTAGQNPDVIEVLRSIYFQLVGTTWESTPGETPAVIQSALRIKAKGQTWLLIVDDVWNPWHLKQINFLQAGIVNMSRSKVLVTSRSSTMMDDCVKIKVGVLTDALAVDMLIQVAALDEVDDGAHEALQNIAKQCGRVPLLLAIVGKMIAEYKGNPLWHTKVPQSLRQSRRKSIGAEVDSGPILGSRVVGASYASMTDEMAKGIFLLFCLTPEDSRVPIPVVELFWQRLGQNNNGLTGSRLTVKVRKVLATLVQRNLLDSMTNGLVAMHDVVRDYGISMVSEAERAAQHATLALMFQSTAPEAGWQRASVDPIGAYVAKCLKHHMSEAYGDGNNLAKAEMARGWLDANTDFFSVQRDFFVEQAVNVVGANRLLKMAKDAATRGDRRGAVIRYFHAALTNQLKQEYHFDVNNPLLQQANIEGVAILDGTSEVQPRMVNALRLAATGAMEDDDQASSTDTLELAVRLLLNLHTNGLAPADKTANIKRIGDLVSSGALAGSANAPTASLSPIADAFFMQGMFMVGYFKSTHANIDNPEIVTKGRALLKSAVLVRQRVASSLHPTDPMWSVVVAESFFYPCVLLNGGMTVALWPHESLVEFSQNYSHAKHHNLCLQKGPQWDLGWMFQAVPWLLLVQHGNIADVRLWLEKLVKIYENANWRDANFAHREALYAIISPLSIAMGPFRRAGLGELSLRALKAVDLTFTGSEATLKRHTSPVVQNIGFDAVEDTGKSVFSLKFFDCVAKTNHFLLAPDEMDREAFEAWLPSPAEGSHRNTNAWDIYPCFDWVWWDPEVFEMLGRHAEAIELAEAQITRFQINSVLLIEAYGVLVRCTAALGRPEVVAAGFFERGITECNRIQAPFLEMMLLRDYIVAVLDPADRREEKMVELGGVVSQMVGDSNEYTAILGHGLDATEALMLYQSHRLYGGEAPSGDDLIM